MERNIPWKKHFFQFSFMHADFRNKTDFKSIFDVSLFPGKHQILSLQYTDSFPGKWGTYSHEKFFYRCSPMYVLKNSWKRQCHKFLNAIFWRICFPQSLIIDFCQLKVLNIYINERQKIAKTLAKNLKGQKGTEIRGNRFIQTWSKKSCSTVSLTYFYGLNFF